MKVIIGLVIVFSIASLPAAEAIKLLKVKDLGVMKHKVIFQSSDVKKVKNTNMVKGKLVVQWGVHVFEIVEGLYVCSDKNVCKLADYERVATYDLCKVRNKKVTCTGVISADSDGGGPSRDVLIGGNPDEISEGVNDIIVEGNPDSVGDEFGQGRYEAEAGF